jgi:sugar fermentation stimulation protein A
MNILKNIRKARFIRRPNRFKAYVDIEGQETMVHVPNTGRCREILLPGSTVILREEPNPLRKTAYDLIAGYKGEVLINIDSQIPNKVVEEALYLQKITDLNVYDIIQREKTFGNSRFDFRISGSLTEEEYYLEVKGVTYEIDGIAKFPDAPTERGAKHLMELVEVKKSGRGAGVLFLIQLSGVKYFSPYDDMDKAFGEALRYAKANGVDVFCYDSIVEESSITLNKSVEVRL